MGTQTFLGELNGDLAQEKLYPEGEIRGELNFDEIVGKSAALRWLLHQVETVAPTESTVLICGETGTGKELVARALHNLSPRRSNAFVKVNCAAIPAGLLESELFGHERGAFTGAIPNESAVSNWQTVAAFFWMRSAMSHSNSSRSCCGCYRSASSSASEARALCARTPG